MADAFLQVVLDNLSFLIREEIGLIMGVDDEMQKLSSTLTTIQAVLEDAEDKQIEDKPIHDWLRKLNALAYEIDDILDDYATLASKLKHADTKLNCYNLKKPLNRHKIGKRMKQVMAKLDSVAAERANFHLRELRVDRPREIAAWRETGSLLNHSDHFFGREEDVVQIVKMLVEDVRENQKMSVLPIVGLGGLGKTTLTRQVFNDPRVVEHFENRLWVCVSDNFDIKKLVKAIIESATGSGIASDLQHLDAVQWSLRELLSQKRYLLVLDDVWNENQEKWSELKDILSCGSTGTSIIVTTRQTNIADIMGTFPDHYQLQGLSDEHCWTLLKQRAFGQQGEESVALGNLEVIGKQIVKKCGGVPLAAKALGGILRFKRREEEWIYVKESEIWNLPQEEKSIMPALRLSYHHLPLKLRQCFAYFAAFPKAYQIEKVELIHLWMAHGYISAMGTLQVEDVGNEVCNELVLRSLLQQNSHVYVHKYELISMHDLVHDLAQSVMENKVPGMPIETNITCASTVRQVNLLENYIFFPKRYQQDMDISSILELLKSVRVLDASNTVRKDLPSTVSNLLHLRYLNLSSSEIYTLPDSLCTIWNLQTLNLDFCRQLVALPKKMRHLHNLRHLCLEDCVSLSEMPPKIKELSGLKTLSMFVVGHDKGNHLEELQRLNLSGRLEIRHLERVKNHMDARKANISEKKNLRKLILSWERNNLSKLDEDVYEKVLEALQPHINLEYLSISGFGGRYFPLWMTNSILGKIIDIQIVHCPNCRRLPKLGELPHLKRMRLENLAVEYIIEDDVENGNSIRTHFLALERLQLTDLRNLKGLSKEQESKEALPNLTVLQIQGCSSLLLPPLSSLQILEVLTCSSSNLALFSEMDTLTDLIVIIEEKLSCFPIETLLNFPNLDYLEIRGAQEISVPQEGLQTAFKKLRGLAILNCKTIRCLPEGLLHHLIALKSLYILSCPEIVELPEEIKHLQNLEFIQLHGLHKMPCLPEALKHISSLTKLHITSLPQLDSLPDWLHQLPSLTYLHLAHCAKVVSLPLLPNLKHLRVKECPKLERRCERGTGEDWPKISHIHRLKIG